MAPQEVVRASRVPLLASHPVIDLRSDVVSPPSVEMWDAMQRAGFYGTPLDDDVLVRELENLGAVVVGKEAALFVPTCTVANLLAMMTLGERGTQVVLEKTAHIATSEEWGLAFICGLVPTLVEGVKGAMSPSQVRSAISYAGSSLKLPTCLLCIENTHTNAGGVVLDEQNTRELSQVAKQHGASVHLDGARLFNAAAALNVPPHSLTASADTVAISLNKGLSAPMGALLCGTTDTIAAARINARRIGVASIHKAGTLAAAGIIALQNRDHLSDDHHKAGLLADLLADVGALFIDRAAVQTNLVKASLAHTDLSANEFVKSLADRGVLALDRGEREVRFVLHRSISETDVYFVAQAAAEVLS